MVDQRLLPHNPADHVAPLKVAHKSMTILNEEQLDAFLTAVKQDAVRKAFFYTELTTSLRLGLEEVHTNYTDRPADAL